jgi:hypothetical protein
VSALTLLKLSFLALILVQEDLIGRKRFLEAAQILLDYGGDVKGALVALVQGNDVSEALRVVRSLTYLTTITLPIMRFR